MESLSGSVERITYYNPENGYSVIRLRPDQRKVSRSNEQGIVTIVGNLQQVTVGEYLRLSGNWTKHPRHGRQFQVEQCQQTLPATSAGIRRYLGSGLIKGIGPGLAERIVNHFREQTLDVIESDAERLIEVPDIGVKRTAMIIDAWEEQKHIKEVMLFLHSYGVSTGLAVKIYSQYQDQAMLIVQSDPYRMAQDIYGVGFKTADTIAQSLGLAEDHPSRIEAGLLYSLRQSIDEGHVYARQEDLENVCADLLEVPKDLFPPALDRLLKGEQIFQEVLPSLEEDKAVIDKSDADSPSPENEVLDGDDRQIIYLTPYYYGEIGVSRRLSALARALPSRLSDMAPAFVKLDSELASEQQLAVKTALGSPVSVLTGGPGTGKTTTLKALIDILEESGKSYALASPTGRAAKRLSEATRQPASTIHRLLKFSPGEGFKINDRNPLSVDLVVVDEASMLDLLLANNLIKAIQPGTHLLLVGDVDQLPSVGAGDVLRDVIASEIAPITCLRMIFRQAVGSHIITNAHRINQGKMPVFPKKYPGGPGDFYLFPSEDADNAYKWILDIVSRRIPGKFGLHPRDQIQVLAPMYRGAAGVNALNEGLQSILNPVDPAKSEKKLFGQVFRTGDKVMQIRNNYKKNVFNGDIGIINEINTVSQQLAVEFDGDILPYDWSEADQLVLAYAVSVHKSQGSEFPAVVVPVITSHYLMLQRNLLYTAVTRAKQLCVLVGSRKAIGISVNNDKVAHRNTALAWRLRGKSDKHTKQSTFMWNK